MIREINPKSNNNDLFKYSILISLHYYDIPYHREKASKLNVHANNYNFSDTNPTYFEKNSPNISLNILSEDNNLIYSSNNDFFKKAKMVKISEYRFAAIKTSSDNFIKQLIKKVSHDELEEILIHLMKSFDNIQLKKVLMGMIKNNILHESE